MFAWLSDIYTHKHAGARTNTHATTSKKIYESNPHASCPISKPRRSCIQGNGWTFPPLPQASLLVPPHSIVLVTLQPVTTWCRTLPSTPCRTVTSGNHRDFREKLAKTTAPACPASVVHSPERDSLFITGIFFFLSIRGTYDCSCYRNLVLNGCFSVISFAHPGGRSRAGDNCVRAAFAHFVAKGRRCISSSMTNYLSPVHPPPKPFSHPHPHFLFLLAFFSTDSFLSSSSRLSTINTKEKQENWCAQHECRWKPVQLLFCKWI